MSILLTKGNASYGWGSRAAAGIAGDYDGTSTHVYSLEDCILSKLNIIDRKPRKTSVASAWRS